MGAIHFSIDEELLGLLCRELPLNIFFETGTFEGESLEIARKYIAECHSVELSPDYYAAAAAPVRGRRRRSSLPGRVVRLPALATRAVHDGPDAVLARRALVRRGKHRRRKFAKPAAG